MTKTDAGWPERNHGAHKVVYDIRERPHSTSARDRSQERVGMRISSIFGHFQIDMIKRLGVALPIQALRLQGSRFGQLSANHYQISMNSKSLCEKNTIAEYIHFLAQCVFEVPPAIEFLASSTMFLSVFCCMKLLSSWIVVFPSGPASSVASRTTRLWSDARYS